MCRVGCRHLPLGPDGKNAGVGMKLDLGVQGPGLVFQCLGPDDIPVEVRAPKDS
jgi:hypothetical protein